MLDFESVILNSTEILKLAMPVLIVLFGLLVGSFLNVCIYRLAKNESIVYPNSHCPKCWTRLGFLDLFPVVSYVALGGKCRYCARPFSPRYAFVELLTAYVFFAAYMICGFNLKLAVYLYMFSVFIVITFIDFDWQIIPDQITINGTAAGLLLSYICWLRPDSAALTFYTPLNDSIWGVLSGGGILYSISVLSGGGMGGGDVKLAALIGAFLGWKTTLLGLLLACFIGSFFGVSMIILGYKKRKDCVAFGPYIALGTAIVMAYGNQETINLYFKLVDLMTGIY
ncbi:MAG TPA: prepilin peptidase [Candidatus Wallbacteria bacterium]|nr:prepilin peptidase [Candidatus Wallbacteria bacterium]